MLSNLHYVLEMSQLTGASYRNYFLWVIQPYEKSPFWPFVAAFLAANLDFILNHFRILPP